MKVLEELRFLDIHVTLSFIVSSRSIYSFYIKAPLFA